jgi:hypothetical protein
VSRRLRARSNAAGKSRRSTSVVTGGLLEWAVAAQ